MPLTSDLTLDASKLDPTKISQKTKDYNAGLIEFGKTIPKWYEVGAAKFRQMRWDGQTPLPKPTELPQGRNITIPSRESSRSIPCRTFNPSNGSKPRGLFLHIHGGGWVLQSEKHQDLMLAFLADECNLAVVSVGYRLAPEHPFPEPNEDCFDVAEYLIDHAEEEFGAKMLFMGGDSAGGHLSVVTAFHLLETRPDFAFKGLVLNFGAYEVAGFLPQVHHFDTPLVLEKDVMKHFINAYLPTQTEAEKRHPSISPLYADLTKMKLPPALFTCGTMDALLDDTIFMSAKWLMTGTETVVKLYPGAPHGFVFFPRGLTEGTEEALQDIRTFLLEHM